MKAKNITGKDVLVRQDEEKGYKWTVVVPNGIIDIPLQYAINLGFSVDNVSEDIDPEIKAVESQVGSVQVETKEIDIQHVEEDIDKIKGIGKKRSKQINKVIEDHARRSK